MPAERGLEACADEYLPRSNQAYGKRPSVRIRHGPPSLSSPNLVGPKETTENLGSLFRIGITPSTHASCRWEAELPELAGCFSSDKPRVTRPSLRRSSCCQAPKRNGCQKQIGSTRSRFRSQCNSDHVLGSVSGKTKARPAKYGGAGIAVESDGHNSATRTNRVNNRNLVDCTAVAQRHREAWPSSRHARVDH